MTAVRPRRHVLRSLLVVLPSLIAVPLAPATTAHADGPPVTSLDAGPEGVVERTGGDRYTAHPLATKTVLMLMAISFGFIVNMSFVIVSRTAMVTIPVMIAVFALLHLKWRTSLMIFGALVVLAGLAFAASPLLQQKAQTVVSDYERYKQQNLATSVGLRLEYWRKSLQFFAASPVAGNGTGSTLGLFQKAASGVGDAATAQVIGNPHNQTLAVAVQWGAAGIIVLYAMWFAHLRLFRGEGLVAWIGLLVVVQNIFTSIFNSHIFDFHEGWMYVLGVGVAGGMMLAARRHNAPAGPDGSL